MIKIYYELIKKGIKFINDVPENLKEAVLTLLDSLSE